MPLSVDKYWDKFKEIEKILFKMSLEINKEKCPTIVSQDLQQGIASAIRHVRKSLHKVLMVDEQYPLYIDEVCHETEENKEKDD